MKYITLNENIFDNSMQIYIRLLFIVHEYIILFLDHPIWYKFYIQIVKQILSFLFLVTLS